MPYDTPHVAHSSATQFAAHPLVRNFAPSVTAPSAAPDIASRSALEMRPIEPMLLLHQEQARTLRLIGATVSRGFKALMG